MRDPPSLRRWCAAVAAALLAAQAAGCKLDFFGNGTTETIDPNADINGEWVFSTTYGCPAMDENGQPITGTCNGPSGSLFLGVSANQITGSWYILYAPTADSATRQLSGTKDGAAIHFTAGACPFTGTVYTGDKTRIRGTYECGHSGSWVAARMVPPAKVQVPLRARTLLRGGAFRFYAYVVDGINQQLGRALTVTSDNPAVAAFSAESVWAGDSGTATITVAAADDTARMTVTSLGLVRLVAVSAGHDSPCVLTDQGVALCWGDNTRGSLGDGTTVFSASPVGVSANVAWARVSANQWRTCALTTAGSPYCWGAVYGTVPRAVPSAVTLTAITTGLEHSCGLSASGVAYCWGSNHSGQLGRAVVGDTAAPAPVAGSHTFTAISAGWSHTCALDISNLVWCWGDNRYGQVGVPASATPVAAPIAVSGGLQLAAVSAGGFYSCGLTAGGAAWCWGMNLGGQLGIGTPGLDSSATPLPVTGGLTFTALSTGDVVACGLAPGGQAYCWGHTSAVDDFARWAPTPVAGALAFVTISVGDRMPCGLASDGYVYCWGPGELGDGSERSSDVPVRVLGQR